MHAAMSSQRIARNFPWVKRYVLQVSHMVFETAAIVLWTGSLFVWLYCQSPNSAPTPQIAIPIYISAIPDIPPRPPNFTVSSGGILISASLAEAETADKMAKMSTPQNHRLLFLINFAPRLLQRFSPFCQSNFRPRVLL